MQRFVSGQPLAGSDWVNAVAQDVAQAPEFLNDVVVAQVLKLR